VERKDVERRDGDRKDGEHNDMDRNEVESREVADFEAMLREAMQREEAPLGLKQRVLAKARERRRAERRPWWQVPLVQRVAVSMVLAAVCGGYAVYHQQAEERRKGEEAREQVMTAFRITSKTLGRVNERLTTAGD
jgi:negative regulator of sigma E activity